MAGGEENKKLTPFPLHYYTVSLWLVVASSVDPYGLLACDLALCGRLWWAHSTLIDRSQLLWLVETGRKRQAGRPAGVEGTERTRCTVHAAVDQQLASLL